MNNPRNLWDILNRVTKQPIDKEQLHNIAKGIHPTDQNNEEKMKQLVQSLTSVLGVKLTPEKEADILKYLKENKFSGLDSINQLIKNSGKK